MEGTVSVTLTVFKRRSLHLTCHSLVAVRIGFARLFTKTHSQEPREVLSRMESMVCPESDTGVTKEGANESLKRLPRASGCDQEHRATKGR